MVKYPRERRGCNKLFSAMRCFSEMIEELNLHDLPLVGVNIQGLEA